MVSKLISWTSLKMATEFIASTVSSDQDVLEQIRDILVPSSLLNDDSEDDYTSTFLMMKPLCEKS